MTVRPRADLWPRLEPLLSGVERPARYVDREWGARHDESEYVVGLVYPDTYELGMANSALAILYERLNALPGVSAERAYVPWVDMASALRCAGVPLPTLESCAPLRDCDLVGITLPYELTYTNVLEVLDLAGIPLRAADRGAGDPFVIGGGPCAFQPEPVAPFFDAILLGDGEEAVVDIVEAHRKALSSGATRESTLRVLAEVPGVYVPSLHLPGSAAVVSKRVLADLAATRAPVCPVVPFVEAVHDRATVEVLRGCSRGCRFCQAGMVYRPVRERSADGIVRDVMAALACTGYEEVSLTSLSTTDHSRIEEVLRRLTSRLRGMGVTVSLPSLRVDSFGIELARLASGGGRKSGLTLAPEAGTQRLRDVVNKNVSEEDLIDAVRAAVGSGWRRVKLYFMIGLPTETDEDVAAIGSLVSRVVATARAQVAPGERGALRIAVSVSTFVPKAHTPFQWEVQPGLEEIRRRQGVLRDAMPRKGVELSWHDPEVSFLEAAFARGGRELSDVVEAAWRAGAVFQGWSDHFSLPRWVAAFEKCGLDAKEAASAVRVPGTALPWSHLSAGLDEVFLLEERERALRGERTGDCAAEGCVECGVCPALGADVRIEGERRG
ncbi:MAG: TIGR03960 family B12-binding radical SAM protein [Coriobacteriia bacterium]